MKIKKIMKTTEEMRQMTLAELHKVISDFLGDNSVIYSVNVNYHGDIDVVVKLVDGYDPEYDTWEDGLELVIGKPVIDV